MERKLLTTKEVADQLGLSPLQVLILARQNKLRCLRISARTIKYTQEEVDRFIEDWQNPNAVVPDFKEKSNNEELQG